jgi:tetratricopeptide (TPR) repeat protein
MRWVAHFERAMPAPLVSKPARIRRSDRLCLGLAALLLAFACSTVDAQETDRGVRLFESGDWAGAKAEFSAALKRNDRDARAHYYLGRMAWGEDEPAAIEHLERAVKLDGGVADYHVWYGRAIAMQAMRAFS